jgi:glycosyltransferase involved in cell wall biosynthesis
LYDAFSDGFALVERGIPVWHLGKRRGFDPRMWPRLIRVLREFRPDVVHSHSYILRYTFPAAMAARTPVMVHSVHNLAVNDVDALGRMVNRAAFRCGVLPVAVSTAVTRTFRVTYGFDPEATIPNGIDVDRFYRPGARREWRDAHGFADDDILIASVARLEPQKDPLGLIGAFARGAAGDARCHLLMAGDGSLLEAARQCAERCGAAGRVHFLGVCADVPELLSASDLFALASRWEGGPLVVLEAMAAGLPVAATAVGGINELTEPGVTALLVPQGDTGGLAGALAALVSDPERRRAMGEAGRRRAARFGVSAMIASYGELFERALKERR